MELVGRLPVRSLYALALVLVVLPLLDVAVAVFPLDPTAASWRFGALGILSRSVTTPLVGLLLALAVALLLSHERTAHLIGIIAGIGSGLLVLSLPLFALDFIQLRAQVALEARASLAVTTALAAAKLLAAATVSWMAAASGTRGARRIAAEPKKSAPLVWNDPPR